MKIIQVMPFFGLGGAEIMCENLVYELRKLGHQVIVISLYSKKTEITSRFENSGIDVRYLDKKVGLDFKLVKSLWKILRKEKPDVIHTHLHVAKYVFPLATLHKIKVVHTVHSVAQKEAQRVSRIMNGVFFKYFKVVPIALSEEVKKTILTEYKLNSDKVPIIFNGIDLSKCQIKSDYSLGETFRIVHVGRFNEVKNHEGLINAFKVFNKKYPNSELHLIGDGVLKSRMEQKASENGLLHKIKFYGSQANVHLYLSDKDIFVLPSLYEGMPMSIIEAMGTGLPIVATNVGGIPDMLNQDSALLIEPEETAIAGAFEEYYLDSQLRERHGKKALKQSVRFSAQTMACEYLQAYRK